MCALVSGMKWDRRESYRQNIIITLLIEVYFTLVERSLVDALVCVLYDNPMRKVLCSIRFADDDPVAQRG